MRPLAMINSFNPVIWNPTPALFPPTYGYQAMPMPMDFWSPAPPPMDFLYGPNPMMFSTVPLPFAPPPPWMMQMPAYPMMTCTTTPMFSQPFSQGAPPIDFNSSFSSAPRMESSSSMSLDQKKALMAERETAFRDNQKNFSKSMSSWGTSLMKDMEERRKAEKEGRV